MPAEEAARTPSSPPQRSEGGSGGAVYGVKKPKASSLLPLSAASRKVCCGILAFFLLAGLIALVVYLVYRPAAPRFAVVGAAVYDLATNSSSTAAPTVAASVQFTVRVRNRSARSSVWYDRLSAYVVYRGQAITAPAPLPALYQEEDSTATVSPVLGGAPVPVSAEVVGGLEADKSYGVANLRLVMSGRLKYRAGPFRSAWYGLHVRCDLLAGVKKGMYGPVPILGGAASCDVDA